MVHWSNPRDGLWTQTSHWSQYDHCPKAGRSNLLHWCPGWRCPTRPHWQCHCWVLKQKKEQICFFPSKKNSTKSVFAEEKLQQIFETLLFRDFLPDKAESWWWWQFNKHQKQFKTKQNETNWWQFNNNQKQWLLFLTKRIIGKGPKKLKICPKKSLSEKGQTGKGWGQKAKIFPLFLGALPSGWWWYWGWFSVSKSFSTGLPRGQKQRVSGWRWDKRHFWQKTSAKSYNDDKDEDTHWVRGGLKFFVLQNWSEFRMNCEKKFF